MNKGFSLIELMIAVLIIGILSSIVYPSYQHLLSKARRNDGKAALIDLASRMEAYYAEQNSYEKASLATGAKTDIAANDLSPSGWYSLRIVKADQRAYSLEATPRNAQALADKQCQTLTLNQIGQPGIAAGPVGSPLGGIKDCW